MGKGAQVTIAALSVFAALGWVILSAGDSAGTFEFFEEVAALRASPAAVVDRDLRVRGFVVEGTIDKNLPKGFVDFAIADKQKDGVEAAKVPTLPVRYDGIDIPDLFRDGAEVVVEGRLGSDGVFVANKLMAKCPSKYENAPPESPEKVASSESF